MVGINALSGEPERWNRPLEEGASGQDDPSFSGLVKGPPEMGADACTDRAKEFVQGINTITVAQKEVKEHVTVYEKRRVSPKMDAVNVTYRGLVYIPIWKVLGTNRSVTVDAHDGRILNEGEGTEGRPAGNTPGGAGGGSSGNDGRSGRA